MERAVAKKGDGGWGDDDDDDGEEAKGGAAEAPAPPQSAPAASTPWGDKSKLSAVVAALPDDRPQPGAPKTVPIPSAAPARAAGSASNVSVKPAPWASAASKSKESSVGELTTLTKTDKAAPSAHARPPALRPLTNWGDEDSDED